MRKRTNSINDENQFGQMTGHSPHSNSRPSFQINIPPPTIVPHPDDTQNLTNEIISKICQLDPQSLATIQQVMTQAFAMSSLQNVIPQQQYTQTPGEFCPFVPVGIITDMNKQTPDIQHDNKAYIPKNYNLEQVFEVPDSMIGYIFNENTNDVVKVKLFENSDGLQTYKPYEEDKQTELDTCKPMSNLPTDIKVENALTKLDKSTTESMTPDIASKTALRKKSQFRRVTANWRRLRNRSLHSKFVKTFQNTELQTGPKQRSTPNDKLFVKKKRLQENKLLTTNKVQGKPTRIYNSENYQS